MFKFEDGGGVNGYFGGSDDDCFCSPVTTGGLLRSTPSSRDLGICFVISPVPFRIPHALVPIRLRFRTHSTIAATALSDFVTDAAGLIDAHDVARVMLDLRSRC